MFEWYCKENTDYVENLIEDGKVPIYWNDVECYYWSPSIILPSGNICDFFCYNKQYAPKHYPWDLKYIINPTFEQTKILKQMKDGHHRTKESKYWKKYEENYVTEKGREAYTINSLSETSVLLGQCVQALKYLDMEHQKYFNR